MQILEEYQEVIDNDAIEISYMWKIMHVILYLSCAISGYVCSVLFYIIQDQVFEGNCPLWAKPVSMLSTEIENEDFDTDSLKNISCTNWEKYVVNDYEYDYICDVYHIACFLSCIFGVAWLSLFLMCGKGGYGAEDAIIPYAPWRIVPPALLFSFPFSLIIIYSNSTFKKGYKEFVDSLKNIFLVICNEYTDKNNISNCEIVKTYVNLDSIHERDVCSLLSWLEGFSAIMTWSWTACFTILLLRVTAMVDFKILKVTISELPKEQMTVQTKRVNIQEENDKHKTKNS